MSENYSSDTEIQNSDVIKRTLFSLIYVAKSKTTKHYAWSIVKNLINELKIEYDFLEFISIGEIDKIDGTIDDIEVSSDFNNISEAKVGKAIQTIIDTFKTKMGAKAGYFFLNEFKEILGDEYYSILKYLGVDLRLIDLQKEIYGWDGQKHKIKDSFDSNIAYIEKNEDN